MVEATWKKFLPVLWGTYSTLLFASTFAVALAMLSNLGVWPSAHPHFAALVAAGEGFCLGTIVGLGSSSYLLFRKSHLIKSYLIASSVVAGCVFLASFVAVQFLGVRW